MWSCGGATAHRCAACQKVSGPCTVSGVHLLDGIVKRESFAAPLQLRCSPSFSCPVVVNKVGGVVLGATILPVSGLSAPERLLVEGAIEFALLTIHVGQFRLHPERARGPQ